MPLRLQMLLLLTTARLLLSASDTPLFSGYSLGPLRNDYTAYVGVQFTVGALPLTVTQLGRMYLSGNQHSHTVKLMRSSDNTDIPNGSVTVSFPAGTIGQFTYAALSTPVVLNPGTTYSLVSFETAGGDQWCDYGGVIPAAGVSVNGPEYQDSDGSWKLLPFVNYSYVPVNLIVSSSNGVIPTTVSITAPAVNTSVSGITTLSAIASAAAGLSFSSLRFSVDGFPVPGTVTGSGGSYSMLFDTTALSNGAHTLTASVVDGSNNILAATAIFFTVNNRSTSVTITLPAANANVSSAINVLATATTSSGLMITSVVFKVDGGAIPGAVSNAGNLFSMVLDSTKLSNASHVLTAVANDSGGNTVTSSPLSFLVSNSPAVTPPTPASMTLPAGMSFDGTVFIAGDEYRFLPTVAGLGPQSINRGVYWFNNVANPIMSLGYNETYSGSLLQAGEPGLSFNIEGNYNDGSGSNKMEAYLQYISENGSVVIRPFMFQIDRTSKKLIGSLLQGDPVNVNSAATGEALTQFWRNGVIVFKPLTVNGAIAGQVIQSIPQTTDPGCDANSIGKIWFDNTTNTTVERHCLSIAGVPTWIVK